MKLDTGRHIQVMDDDDALCGSSYPSSDDLKEWDDKESTGKSSVHHLLQLSCVWHSKAVNHMSVH